MKFVNSYPDLKRFERLDLDSIATPAFVVDAYAVEQNLDILKSVADESGAKVLAALKAFSMWRLGKLTANYLHGVCASGIHEARLGAEEYVGSCKSENSSSIGGEVHVFSAAFSATEFHEVCAIAHHVVFNSMSQYQRFYHDLHAYPQVQFGLRINPEHSEGAVPLYDPCAPNSRLGIKLAELKHFQEKGVSLDKISGLHFHTLCEQGFAPLDRTLDKVEESFGWLIKDLEWCNFGGGHHITQVGYDIPALVKRIKEFASKYQCQVYLEPGEAVAINTGVLVASVLDIRGENQDQLILDTSATCHMPDTLEMPYRPDIFGAGKAKEKKYTYQLGGMTCLAGDSLGEYSFAKKMEVGDKIMFMDMSHYTMVKTTTFNGINLPNIFLWHSEKRELETVRSFGYEDFKMRLS